MALVYRSDLHVSFVASLNDMLLTMRRSIRHCKTNKEAKEPLKLEARFWWHLNTHTLICPNSEAKAVNHSLKACDHTACLGIIQAQVYITTISKLSGQNCQCTT